MKAAQIDEYGDSSVIQVREIEKPIINDGQVLVEVGAASLNPFDAMVLAGFVKNAIPGLPITLGLDIAGTVVELGSGVTQFAVGDKVYGSANVLIGGTGAFAEFAATGVENLAHAPADTTDTEAASLVLAGVSALQSVVDTLDVVRGQKVFINGGAGGIGSIAIQIAKHLGAHVVTTASTDNYEFVSDLGADEVIDYKSQKYTEIVHNADVAFDTVGGDNLNDVLLTIKKGGRAATMAGQFDEQKASANDITATSVHTKVSTEALDRLRELVEQGAVKPLIGKTVPLDNVADAYTALKNTSIRGKIVIEVK